MIAPEWYEKRLSWCNAGFQGQTPEEALGKCHSLTVDLVNIMIGNYENTVLTGKRRPRSVDELDVICARYMRVKDDVELLMNQIKRTNEKMREVTNEDTNDYETDLDRLFEEMRGKIRNDHHFVEIKNGIIDVLTNIYDVHLRAIAAPPQLQPAIAQPESALALQENCSICFDRVKTHTFLPCGHFCSCSTCADRIMQSDRKCPICRAQSSITRIYG